MIPVGNAGVEHASGSAVDGDGLRAIILHPGSKVQHIHIPLVPAQTALNGHRNLHRITHRPNNPAGQLRLLHQAAAVAVLGDFGHGTSHVDINKITAGNLCGHHSGLRHNGRIVAENLRTADTGIPFQQSPAFLILIHQRPAGHHFGHGHAGTHLCTDGPECQIRHTRHGRKGRITGNFDISNFHRFRLQFALF